MNSKFISTAKYTLSNKMRTDDYGNKFWYNANVELHRDNDLPAIEYIGGNKVWWINGQIHRDNDLPAFEDVNGDKYWFVNGKCHRDNDLPAGENANGDKHWFANGKQHRLGGLPATEYADGNKEWYIYGNAYTYEQVCNNYQILTRFGRYCLKKIRMRRLKQLRWIHGELLCMPPKGSYPGGQDYHKMVNYFMSM
jgi:hypothetical protein